MQKAISKGENPTGVGNLFVFEQHQLEDTVNDEADDFPTIIQVDGGMATQVTEVHGGTETGQDHMRAYVYSPVLVNRYGIITEQQSIPYAGQNDTDYSVTGGDPFNSVMGQRLAKLALLEYMKRLADSSTWDGTVGFRPFLFPNRPLWMKRSSRIGNLTTVTNRWSIGKSGGTNLSMNMLMSERSDGKGSIDYRLPTGASNTPISYADVWSSDVKGFKSSGVRAEVGTANQPPADQPANGSAGSVGSTTQPIQPPTKVQFDDEQYMYKPFTEIIKKALDAAKGVLPAIAITSTYRSPQYQADMKRRQLSGDPQFQKFAVGCAWRSMHQYGCAIDIWISGNKYSDYQNFYAICDQVSDGRIYWGDAYKRNGGGDYIHYEYKPKNLARIGSHAKDVVKSAGTT